MARAPFGQVDLNSVYQTLDQEGQACLASYAFQLQAREARRRRHGDAGGGGGDEDDDIELKWPDERENLPSIVTNGWKRRLP